MTMKMKKATPHVKGSGTGGHKMGHPNMPKHAGKGHLKTSQPPVVNTTEPK